MPDVSIVDAHLHLWDPTHFRMSWLDTIALLNKPYGPAEYRTHTEGLPIEAMVYLQVEVEPAYALLEARWVEERAKEDPRIQGIVAWRAARIRRPGARLPGRLAGVHVRLSRASGACIQFEPNLDFCLQPRLRARRATAGRLRPLVRHLHRPPPLPEHDRTDRSNARRSRASSTTSAKPNIKEHMLDPWRAHIARAGGAAQRRLQGQRHGDGGRPSALDAGGFARPS